MSLSPECQKCMKDGLCQDKVGLPILLTRYAIAPQKSGETDAFFGGSYPEGVVIGYDGISINRRYDMSDSKAPKISGHFKINEKIELGKGAMYTQRMLRSGYVYVVDNKNRWQAYFVNQKAFMMPLQVPSTPGDPPVETNKVPCKAFNHAKASCITIFNPKEVDTIWIAFSDVEWTEDVWERHQDISYRDRHMRQFKVKKWVLESLEQSHVAPIKELSKHVADYSDANEEPFRFSRANTGESLLRREIAPSNYPSMLSIPKKDGGSYSYNLLEWSHLPTNNPEEYKKISQNIDSTKQIKAVPSSPAKDVEICFEKILPGKGILIALDDPAGITADLAALTELWVDAFSSQKQYARKLIAYNNIESLRAAIHDIAAKDYDKSLSDTLGNARKIIDNEPGLLVYNRRLRFRQESEWMRYQYAGYRTGDLEAAFTNSEHNKRRKGEIQEPDLPKRFDEAASAAFKGVYDEAFAKFESLVVKPLAEAHAKWLTSKSLAYRFICNYSKKVPQQGGEYVELLSACIATMQNQPACMQVILDWMNGKITDDFNLLLRGIVLNQEDLADSMEKFFKNFEELKARYRPLLQEMEKISAGPNADQVISPETRKKLIDFASDWSTLVQEAVGKTKSIMMAAYSDKPVDVGDKVAPGNKGTTMPLFKTGTLEHISDIPAAPDIPVIPDSPVQRLMAQVSSIVRRHMADLDRIAPGSSSVFTSAAFLHNESVQATILVSGRRDRISRLVANQIARGANMPGGRVYGLTQLVENQISTIFTNTPNPNEIVTVRVGMNYSASENLYAEPTCTNAVATRATRMLMGEVTIIPARAVSDMSDIIHLARGQTLLGFLNNAREADLLEREIAGLQTEIEHATNERDRALAEARERERDRLISERDKAIQRNEQMTRQNEVVTAHNEEARRHNEEVERQNEAIRRNESLRNRVKRIDERNKLIAKGKVNMAYSGFGLALSVYAISNGMAKTGITANAADVLEARSRYVASFLSFISSSSDMLNKAIDIAKNCRFTTVRRYGRSLRLGVGRELAWIAKRFGAPAGFILGGWDIVNTVKAYDKDQFMLVGLYASSAGVGIGSAIYMLRAAPKAPIVWGLLIAAFVIDQIISYLKDDKLMEYLDQCEYSLVNRQADWSANWEEHAFLDATSL